MVISTINVLVFDDLYNTMAYMTKTVLVTNLQIKEHILFLRNTEKVYDVGVFTASGKHVCAMYPIIPRVYVARLGYSELYLSFLLSPKHRL